MTFKPINPLIANVFLDSCALDPKYHPEDNASMELYDLYDHGELVLHIAHSTQKEIDHPNTPVCVKRIANTCLFTCKVQNIEEEIKRKEAILKILAGNGNPDAMRSDAEHVFEASKYGSYFVTTDARILNKRAELQHFCGVIILRPSEIMGIIREYKAI
ncbi:MAG: hypothetical protein M0022_01480 [Desulfobacteraceae bacterium]|nr:hypothetical protein [Desulfobacteraceae bacterium]